MTDALIGPVEAPDLHVMTYNIRRRFDRGNWRAADRWTRRRPLVQSLVRTERPTLLGAQEVRPDQARTLQDALGSRYRFVGRGRNRGGRGEGNPLFYDTERLELLDWSQEALADRPDEEGARGWGNLVPRVLVTATFRDRLTGAMLFAVNTHFDHLSGRARRQSAVTVRRRVAAQPHPAIVTGDLNTGERTAPIQELLGDGTLTDAWAEASVHLTPEWGTFPNYRPPRVGGARIDWIAVSPDVEVLRAGINPARVDGAWPSDHLPVQAVVRMRGEEASA
ncbi:endonuclease/exonuclease/phosphatase family protein [Microbacterium sp. BK668]|uniref:endonuclease/exonuclease/phosphatase family protein n=1 Tax=Microbacterium sp. BK668 TaxID=2512118 RepID=UPI0010E2DC90|nr:endonuclease/exonuclease/phosphatase family protein [Microbacterium sp. BK668]TDN92037.1 endonuclease/exonuclease/phosphatase family metal-dependent hydrolase [Microbacterium sp. BK668]